MMYQSLKHVKKPYIIGWVFTCLVCAHPSHLLYNQLILQTPVALQKLTLAISQNLCVGDGMAEPPTRFVVHRTCQGWVKSQLCHHHVFLD